MCIRDSLLLRWPHLPLGRVAPGGGGQDEARGAREHDTTSPTPTYAGSRGGVRKAPSGQPGIAPRALQAGTRLQGRAGIRATQVLGGHPGLAR
eukprot:3654482-Alexandrium_andersonii.AAC.1